jgi:GR25 family glycosyltransferase involved in LPS biosynthesis
LVFALRHETFVITLDPQGARFAAFRAANPHLPCHVAKAVRGADVSRAERLASGLVNAQALDAGAVSDGEIGCAASHRALWRESARHGLPFLILEDDVFTHPGLLQALAQIDFDFDIIFFAVNTDTILVTFSPEGVREFSNFEDRYPSPARIKQILAQTNLARLSYRRLLNGFGTSCYLVSPQGAAKLADRSFPLRLDSVAIDGMPGASVRGTSIDRRMNALYPALRAFVLRPFLAWTPNQDSSTR